MFAIAILEIVIAPLIARIFFPDASSSVYMLTNQLFEIYGFAIPLTLICIVYSNYCQAAGHRLFANLASVMDGFLGVVIPAALLAPVLGAFGVWMAFPIGLCLTLAAFALYPISQYKRIPRGLEEWLILPEDFGAGNHLILRLHHVDELTCTAQNVQDFCKKNGISNRISLHAGLCLEEMAGNILNHGFTADQKKHVIEVRVVIREKDVVLRIKDDCIPFNPKEWYEMTHPDDPFANLGIKMVYGLTDEVEYQNLLGLNVLTIRLDYNSLRGGEN
jgi:anti-sigma regulatory factor (Ser/Thr protein kinase)